MNWILLGIFAILIIPMVSAIEETNYEKDPMHSVIIKTTIKIVAPVVEVANFTNASSSSGPTFFYKMNGTYVSIGVCSTFVGGCVEDPVPPAPRDPRDPVIVFAPVNNLTKVKDASQCTTARNQDWQVYLSSMYNEHMPIDPNANSEEKTMILDILAGQRGSAQFRCIYGV